MLQGPYTISSVSSLSLDQPNQSDSPNGKITPAVLCLWWQNRHCLVKFWKCQTAVSILPHEAKALLDLFCGIMTGSDSILYDQDWTPTEKFHCPLISGLGFYGKVSVSSWNLSQVLVSEVMLATTSLVSTS